MSNLYEVLDQWKNDQMSTGELKYYFSKLITMQCCYCKRDYKLEDIVFTGDRYTAVCSTNSCRDEADRITSLVHTWRCGDMSVDEFISKVQ